MSSAPLVAVLGGGQLGRMLGLAGLPLGLRFRFLDPSPEAPAGAVGELVVAALDDPGGLARVADGAVAVTYEWEGVPAAGARGLAGARPVLPPPIALEVTQDRAREKELCRDLGIATAPFRVVDDRADLDQAAAELGFPAVLKTRGGGYDGKGQWPIGDVGQLDEARAAIGDRPAILEAQVPFSRELSVLAVRARDGTTACWPLVENHHAGGILRGSLAPAPELDVELQRRGEAIATAILERLGYVGVLAVELFESEGELLVNELAPRVHNSGHWTIEGAETSQFENHLRAVLGWPLGSTAAVALSAMVNCIGALPSPEQVLAVPNTHFHRYGKEPRPGRKLGHITVTAATPEELDDLLARLRGLPGTVEAGVP